MWYVKSIEERGVWGERGGGEVVCVCAGEEAEMCVCMCAHERERESGKKSETRSAARVCQALSYKSVLSSQLYEYAVEDIELC